MTRPSFPTLLIRCRRISPIGLHVCRLFTPSELVAPVLLASAILMPGRRHGHAYPGQERIRSSRREPSAARDDHAGSPRSGSTSGGGGTQVTHYYFVSVIAV